MSAPTANTARTTVRFRGGHLDGAILDLPPRLADAHPSQIRVTSGGNVMDVARGQVARDANVVRPPGRYNDDAPGGETEV